jgi:hypothetical protein
MKKRILLDKFIEIFDIKKTLANSIKIIQKDLEKTSEALGNISYGRNFSNKKYNIAIIIEPKNKKSFKFK